MDRKAFVRRLAGISGMVLVAANLHAATPDARAMLAEAEKAVAGARAQNALWTTAEEALMRARRALEAGEEVTAREQARVAIDQAALGIAQTRYPPTR